VKLKEHVWRTGSGDLVRGGDPDAAMLAYTKGEEFNDHEWQRLGLAALFVEAAAPKAAKAHADKAMSAGEDK
jgi:hypothetical protein